MTLLLTCSSLALLVTCSCTLGEVLGSIFYKVQFFLPFLLKINNNNFSCILVPWWVVLLILFFFLLFLGGWTWSKPFKKFDNDRVLSDCLVFFYIEKEVFSIISGKDIMKAFKKTKKLSIRFYFFLNNIRIIVVLICIVIVIWQLFTFLNIDIAYENSYVCPCLPQQYLCRILILYHSGQS